MSHKIFIHRFHRLHRWDNLGFGVAEDQSFVLAGVLQGQKCKADGIARQTKSHLIIASPSMKKSPTPWSKPIIHRFRDRWNSTPKYSPMANIATKIHR